MFRYERATGALYYSCIARQSPTGAANRKINSPHFCQKKNRLCLFKNVSRTWHSQVPLLCMVNVWRVLCITEILLEARDPGHCMNKSRPMAMTAATVV
jgi:hypothetical protein